MFPEISLKLLPPPAFPLRVMFWVLPMVTEPARVNEAFKEWMLKVLATATIVRFVLRAEVPV